MTEAAAIAAVAHPATRASLAADLRTLGVVEGSTMLVHTSLSRLGFVVGGAQAVVLALFDAVGPAGTLVMPTHSALSDPSRWQHPPVPDSWWPILREHLPAFDPYLTPTRQMGAAVECFRHLPGVVRSGHPNNSFAAAGPRADQVTADHRPAFGLGEGSPLARLYDLDASVLLLGVDHAHNTSLHLAEHRTSLPVCPRYTEGAAVMVDGERRWINFDELDHDADDFDVLGEAFAATGGERSGPVGGGVGRLMGQRAVVDFAVTWLECHRPPC